MPVLSGFEAISILRKLEATSNAVRVPVVACTAESLKEPWQGLGGDETLHSRCLAMGFDAAVVSQAATPLPGPELHSHRRFCQPFAPPSGSR